MCRTLNCELDCDGIQTITLNRPERLNAFTPGMCAELVDAFRRASDDDAVRAVIVTGSGRAFCAGMDLGGEENAFGLNQALRPTVAELEAQLEAPEIGNGVRDTGGRVTLAIRDCLKPVIAAINGPAVGIGATMTLAMDIRLAAEDTHIGFVFGPIGIVPEACSTWYLPRLVGLQRALERVYSAEPISATEARDAGLDRSIHPAEGLLDEARAGAPLHHRPLGGRHGAGAADASPQ